MKKILLMSFWLLNSLNIYANDYFDYDLSIFNYTNELYYQDSLSNRHGHPLPRNIVSYFSKQPVDRYTEIILYKRLNHLREKYGVLQKGEYLFSYEEDGRTHKSLFETIQKTESKIHVLFINGIETSPDEFKDHLRYLIKITPHINLYAVYNSTRNFERDVFASHLGLCGIETPPTLHLRNGIKHIYKHLCPEDKFIILCDQEGSIHTYNALQGLSEEIREMIHIVAIAPTLFISTDLAQNSLNIISSDYDSSLQSLYGFTEDKVHIKKLKSKIKSNSNEKKQTLQNSSCKKILKERFQ